MLDWPQTSRHGPHEQDKRQIIDRLRGAGWAMAEGAETLDRAALVYANGQMSIELSQDDQERELLLTLAAPDGTELTVCPVYGAHLDETLDSVVGFQDRINPDNFRDTLRELVAACPEVYYQPGDDEEPRLLTDE